MSPAAATGSGAFASMAAPGPPAPTAAGAVTAVFEIVVTFGSASGVQQSSPQHPRLFPAIACPCGPGAAASV
jgi:hypothetical protein